MNLPSQFMEMGQRDGAEPTNSQAFLAAVA